MLIILRHAANHFLPNDNAKGDRLYSKLDGFTAEDVGEVSEQKARCLLNDIAGPLFNVVENVSFKL